MPEQIPPLKKDEKIVVSGKFEIIYQDIKKALTNSAIFAAPLLLVGLLALQSGKTLDEVMVLVYGAGLQLLIDLTLKYIKEVRYIVPKV